MLDKPVKATDTDKNGKVTMEEVMVATHKAYNKANGYVFGGLRSNCQS